MKRDGKRKNILYRSNRLKKFMQTRMKTTKKNLQKIQPLTFLYIYQIFRIPSISNKWCPFQNTLLSTLIPFDCCKCTVFYIEVNLKNSLYTDVVLFFFSLATPLLWRSMEHISTGEITTLSYTAISRKVVGKKMYTQESPKVIWDMINTLFLTL